MTASDDDLRSRLRFGFLGHHTVGRPVAASDVRALEELGAHSLWAAGHLSSGRPIPEAMTGVVRLAAFAERATVGTAVLLAPLYHPVIVAKQFAELDVATGGRAVLGVGVGGEYRSEFAAMEVELADRGPRTDEAIAVVRALWAGGPTDHKGTFWSFEGVDVTPPPVRPGGPPIVVAGRKQPAMRRAAALGDGWMPFLYSPDQYRRSLDTIRAHSAAIGRNLDAFDWMSFVYVSVDDDPSVARQRALEYIGAGQAGDAARFAAMVERIAAVGTPADVAARLQEFVDAGARHFILVPCTADGQLESARRLMHEVVPTLEVRDADQ